MLQDTLPPGTYNCPSPSEVMSAVAPPNYSSDPDGHVFVYWFIHAIDQNPIHYYSSGAGVVPAAPLGLDLYKLKVSSLEKVSFDRLSKSGPQLYCSYRAGVYWKGVRYKVLSVGMLSKNLFNTNCRIEGTKVLCPK